MSLFRNPLANSLGIASAALAMILSASACNSNSFTGGSGSRGSLNLDEKGDKDGKDDGNDEGKDEGLEGDGIEGDDGGDGVGDDDGGIDVDDGKSDDGESDISDGDDEVSKKTRSDLQIQQTLADDETKVKIDLFVDGEVEKSDGFVSSATDGKVNISTTLQGMCRKGQTTCLKATFTGKATEIAGISKCIHITSEGDKKTVKLSVDADGKGDCDPNQDEIFIFSCPESTKLKVANQFLKKDEC